MIFLFTDFGAEGPYLGQMEAALRRQAPGMEVVNLVSNAPSADPRLSGYLLAALARTQPEGSVFLCVIDPGVGGERLPVVLEADRRWFVGPDNGLFHPVAAQSEKTAWRAIRWRPRQLSASFHGRDLFAPIAARIAQSDFGWSGDWEGPLDDDWSADLAAIIYFDHYGNAMTGMRYRESLEGRVLLVNGHPVPQAKTFCDRPAGASFWYCNSMNLIEIAVNRGRADRMLELKLGQSVSFDGSD